VLPFTFFLYPLFFSFGFFLNWFSRYHLARVRRCDFFCLLPLVFRFFVAWPSPANDLSHVHLWQLFHLSHFVGCFQAFSFCCKCQTTFVTHLFCFTSSLYQRDFPLTVLFFFVLVPAFGTLSIMLVSFSGPFIILVLLTRTPLHPPPRAECIYAKSFSALFLIRS